MLKKESLALAAATVAFLAMTGVALAQSASPTMSPTSAPSSTSSTPTGAPSTGRAQ